MSEENMGASGKPDRAVVNGAGQAVSAVPASVPSAGSVKGDQTNAAALHIAYEHVKAMGWKRAPREIGETAREILKGLENTGDG